MKETMSRREFLKKSLDTVAATGAVVSGLGLIFTQSGGGDLRALSDKTLECDSIKQKTESCETVKESVKDSISQCEARIEEIENTIDNQTGPLSIAGFGVAMGGAALTGLAIGAKRLIFGKEE